MTRFIQEGPMWRRAAISMVAIPFTSAAFVAVVMLVLGSIVDMAVAPTTHEDKAESAKSEATTGAQDKSPSLKSKGSDGPGERS
jgi:hypothetical protein